MARSRLSKPLTKEDEELLVEFCEALVALSTPEEAGKFLSDLLSNVEARMFARRLKIAKFLLAGWTFSEIENSLKVGPATIARVGEWLKIYGDGYRLVEQRTKRKLKQPSLARDHLWRNLKRRAPLAFWPEMLIEDLVRNANKKQRERMTRVLRAMDQKSELYKRIDQLLKQ